MSAVKEILKTVEAATLTYEERVLIGRVVDKKQLDGFIKMTSGSFCLQDIVKQTLKKSEYAQMMRTIKLHSPEWLKKSVTVKHKTYVPHAQYESVIKWIKEHA